MPTSKDWRWELKDYQNDLAGLSAFGVAEAFKAIRHEARFGTFMPTPQQVIAAHDEAVNPVKAVIQHRKEHNALKAEKQAAIESSQKMQEYFATPKPQSQVDRVSTIYKNFVERYEANKAKDIQTRVERQQDDAKLFLDKVGFAEMQRRSPDIHRHDSPIAGSHLVTALEKKKGRAS